MNSLDTKVARFDELMKEITRDMRDNFDAANISELTIRVEVSGRVNGDINITYEIGGNRYDHPLVKGNDLYDCMTEYLRRHGWYKNHAPTLISAA